MALPLPALVLAALAALAGCGDSLLGELGVNEPLGLEDPPEADELAWEIRWYAGDGQGLTAPCALHDLSAAPTWDADAASFGYLDSPGPVLTDVDPAVVLQGDGYTWSLGLALLVRSTGQRAATADAPEGGVEGLAVYQALLDVDGDVDAFVDDLDVWFWEDDVMAGLAPGKQWLDLSAWDAVTTGSFVGTLTVGGFYADGLVLVDALDIVEPAVRPLWTGEGLGGVTFEACP